LQGAVTLLLTFAPEVVPSWAPGVVVILTSAIVLAIVVHLIVRTIKRVIRKEPDSSYPSNSDKTTRVGQRGVVFVGRHSARSVDFSEILLKARRRVLVHGVGMTSISRERDLILGAARNGLEIDFVMIDPAWLKRTRGATSLLNQYYDEPKALLRVEKAHRDLTAIATEVGEELAGSRVRIHTYGALSFFGAIIADPGVDDAEGIVEFHVPGGSVRRIRLGLEHIEDGPEGRAVLSQITDASGELVGKNFRSMS
jgi:hypothetical protein